MNHSQPREWARRPVAIVTLAILPLVLLLGIAGCQTKKGAGASPPQFASSPALATATNSDVIVLHEGDTVRITFPGAADLNTVQVIRRDGRITLKSIGEFKAAGLTPPEMETQLLQLYGPQLQIKEVTVSVDSSAFPVYVTGAVLRPGKILSDRPITALQAIMEAGGFDYSRANLKSIRVLRTQGGQTEHYTLNLKIVLQGQESERFSLKPADIVYVPEKFSLF